MNITEIRNYLAVGRQRSVCVQRELSAVYPGLVRELVIHGEQWLHVNFDDYSCDEGGLSIHLQYPGLEAMVAALEHFTGCPIGHWENINRSGYYPPPPGAHDQAGSAARFKADLRQRRIALPAAYQALQIPDGYWRDVFLGRQP